MASSDLQNTCVKCGGSSIKQNPLHLIGALKGKKKDGQNGKHHLDKLLEQSRLVNLEKLTRTLENNKDKKCTHLHPPLVSFISQ